MSAVAAVPETPPEEKTPRQSYKAREIQRATKFVNALANLHLAAQGIGAKQAALDLIEAAGNAVDTMLNKVLASMPDSLEAPRGSQSHTAEVGDVVSPTEEATVLYGKGDRQLTVKEVVKLGGNAEGKGAKTFLKCKREDGTVVTVPASHFE